MKPFIIIFVLLEFIVVVAFFTFYGIKKYVSNAQLPVRVLPAIMFTILIVVGLAAICSAVADKWLRSSKR